MQGRQIPTSFRQFPTNRTPFLKNLSGVRIGYLLAFLLVIRLGLEPKTPTLKVLCSTC